MQNERLWQQWHDRIINKNKKKLSTFHVVFTIGIETNSNRKWEKLAFFVQLWKSLWIFFLLPKQSERKSILQLENCLFACLFGYFYFFFFLVLPWYAYQVIMTAMHYLITCRHHRKCLTKIFSQKKKKFFFYRKWIQVRVQKQRQKIIRHFCFCLLIWLFWMQITLTFQFSHRSGIRLTYSLMCWVTGFWFSFLFCFINECCCLILFYKHHRSNTIPPQKKKKKCNMNTNCKILPICIFANWRTFHLIMFLNWFFLFFTLFSFCLQKCDHRNTLIISLF